MPIRLRIGVGNHEWLCGAGVNIDMSTLGRGRLVAAEVDLDLSPDPRGSTGIKGGPASGGPVDGPTTLWGLKALPMESAALL